MFGLEKKDKKVTKFDFDLEVEIHEDPEKADELLRLSKKRVEELKKFLKEEKNSESFDDYGVLLHGYAALSRVLKKIVKQGSEKK